MEIFFFEEKIFMGIDCEDYMLKLNIKYNPKFAIDFNFNYPYCSGAARILIFTYIMTQLFKINDRIIQESNSIMIFWSSSYVFE